MSKGRKMDGRAFWITGLPNSGKTSIGTALYYYLRKKRSNVVILDGDILKEIASGSENAEYSYQDRLLRARRYSRITKLLVDQGMWVIICTISMFDEVREWNRENIRGYIEIYLNVPESILIKRNKRNIKINEKEYQAPNDPDLVLTNDESISIKEMVKMIASKQPRRIDDYDRDKNYWNHYYENIRNDLVKPSSFAVYVEKLLIPQAHILELGCGNGRDSMFFLSKGHNVVAVDGSDAAIDMLNDFTRNMERALFVCDDFVKCHSIYQLPFDCIYSRFTLHAITEEQEDELIDNVKEGLCEEGLFCIEARTIHDEIYGLGEKIGENEYIYNDHYRRFIDVERFESKLKKKGFEIITLEEKRGFSKTDDSDPVLMRCIVKMKKG